MFFSRRFFHSKFKFVQVSPIEMHALRVVCVGARKFNVRTHTHNHPHCTHGTCGVLHCLLFCDQTRPNLRISLVGYHCSIEFPCGVPLFYCCKYPTTYGVRVHRIIHAYIRACTLYMYSSAGIMNEFVYF